MVIVFISIDTHVQNLMERKRREQILHTDVENPVVARRNDRKIFQIPKIDCKYRDETLVRNTIAGTHKSKQPSKKWNIRPEPTSEIP